MAPEVISRTLPGRLVRLAHARPELRPHLLPILRRAAGRSASSADELEAAYDSPEWAKVRKAGETYNRAVRDLTKALTAWIRKYPRLRQAQEWRENMDSMFNEVFWM